MSGNTRSVHNSSAKKREKYFTLGEANASLGYVCRVAQDLVDGYRFALRLKEMGEMGIDYDIALENLDWYLREIEKFGVILVDLEIGVLDFPMIFDGREIRLRWSLRVPGGINSWHEIEDKKLQELHLLIPKIQA